MNYKKILLKVSSYVIVGIAGYIFGKINSKNNNSKIQENKESQKTIETQEINELTMSYPIEFEYDIEDNNYIVKNNLIVDKTGTHIDGVKVSKQNVNDISSFKISIELE
jgi:isopropylmalate/homocitrate/citramalate synthase